MSKYLATSALMAVSLLIGAAGATIYAQATTPIYAVAEINVKDKDSYDKILPKALELEVPETRARSNPYAWDNTG
jgi:hypothetical protein